MSVDESIRLKNPSAAAKVYLSLRDVSYDWAPETIEYRLAEDAMMSMPTSPIVIIAASRPVLTHEMKVTGKGYSGDGWLAFAHAEAFRMDGGKTMVREGIHVEVSRSELSLAESALLADALMRARGEVVACAEKARGIVDKGRAVEAADAAKAGA